MENYSQSLVHSIFGPDPNAPQIIKALAIGAIAAVSLPALADAFAWLRLYVFSSSKLYRYQHAPLTTPTDSSLNFQAWALVTGATDGIGYGFVCELASRNVNVILHGRNAEKLERIIGELKAKHPRLHFEPFICDATDRPTWHGKVTALIADLRRRNINLTILINNVGGNPNAANTFSALETWGGSDVNRMIDMNVVFPVQMTRALLPILIANKPSLIVNMSSIAAHTQLPWMVPYCASKAFNSQFSRTLRVEMAAEGHGDEEEGVEVLSVTAAKVQSFSQPGKASLTMPSSRDFAKSVFNKVGSGEDEFLGWWAHSIQVWVVGFLNDWVRNWFTKKAISKEKKELEERLKKAT